MRLKKFNEHSENDNDYQEVENGIIYNDILYIGDAEYLGSEIGTSDFISANDIVISEDILTLPDGTKVQEGIFKNSSEFVVISKNDKIEVVIGVYELSNCTVFNDVLVIPGHDEIILFNMKTKQSKNLPIR